MVIKVVGEGVVAVVLLSSCLSVVAAVVGLVTTSKVVLEETVEL